MTEQAQPATASEQLLYQNSSDIGRVEVRSRPPWCSLYINNVEQSRINLQCRDELALAVHQSMLVVLLFAPPPEYILLGGLGGGAIPRYLAQVLPESHGDVVEIDSQVIDLCQQYFDFPQTGWNIHNADIMHWRGNHYDWLLLDIAEGNATPAWLVSEAAMASFKQQLSGRGILLINLLVKDVVQLASILATMRHVFERRTLCLTVPGHQNIIVMAFNDAPPLVAVSELQQRCETLTLQYGIDFSALLTQLLKDNPPGNGIVET